MHSIMMIAELNSNSMPIRVTLWLWALMGNTIINIQTENESCAVFWRTANEFALRGSSAHYAWTLWMTVYMEHK